MEGRDEDEGKDEGEGVRMRVQGRGYRHILHRLWSVHSAEAGE